MKKSLTKIFSVLHNTSKHINSYKRGVLSLDIVKQNSPWCDAAKRGVPSGAILFAYRISSKNEIKMKNYS